MQDLLEKLKLDSQVGVPLPGGDLLEKLKLDSGIEPGLEEPEPIPEPTELPELYPKPGIMDKIRDLTMQIKPDLMQPVLAKMKEESAPREFRGKPAREKGPGYFGPLKRPDGRVSTELSFTFTGPEYNNREIEAPLLVPTLSREEIEYLLSGKDPTEEIYRKAEDHARVRLTKGLSPFSQGEPTIRAATPGEEEFAEKRGTIYGMATQPERAKTETIQGEGWSKDPKFNYWSEKIAHRAPMWMTAFAGAPSIIAIFELLTQAKNATHSLIEKSKYDPLASRQLSELIPEDSPKWLKTVATTGEYAGDMVIAALASKRISKSIWEKNMKDLLGGIKKAGWFDEMARATGKGTADDWHGFYQDLIKQTTRPETIEAELQRLFKIRGGVPSPPARQIRGVTGREQPNIPVLIDRIKPPVIPELQRAPSMITTEEGVSFRPGTETEPELTLARYRAAEGKPIYPEAAPRVEVAPETQVTIDVTPKPGGGQTITIKSPERPVEPRTPVEPTPITPPEVITQRKAPEYRQDPLLAAVAEIGGIKADQDYKHADLKKLLPLNLIKAAKGKAGQFMDEAAQEISGLHPELKIEDAESLWGALEVRRYEEKKPLTEKQRDIEAEEYYKGEAEIFKEKERNLAGILYEEDWINDNTSVAYTDVVEPDIEDALGQSLKPGEPITREGTKFNYTFEVDDAEKVLFIKREKFAEPEQKALEIEKPEIVKPEKPEVAKVKPRVPEFGETKPVQMGLDTEESGKLKFAEKAVAPKTGEELTPEQKKALGEKYEDLGKTAGAEKEEPLPEVEEEKIPEKMKMVNLSIRDPNGEMFDLGRVPVDKLKNIRDVARRHGVTNRLKIGEPFTGKWKEFYSPTEHEKFVNEIIRDVKEVPAEEWKKWELFSGYPVTKEIKRAVDAIAARQKRRKKIAMDELKAELQKTDEGKVQWMYIETEAKLKQKRSPTFRKAFRGAKRALVDTSGNIKKDLLKNMGDLGKEATIQHDLIAGASGKAERLYSEAEKNIYKGLSKKDETLLNWLIQSRRTAAISKYRPDKGYKPVWGEKEKAKAKPIRHPHGLTGEQHEKWMKDIPKEIEERADLYHKEYEKILDEYFKEGLESKRSVEDMKSKGDYSPRWFIQYLDPEISHTIGGKTITVPSSGIKALDEGSYQVMETNSRLLLQSAISRAQGRIFRNRANKSAYEIAKEIPDNGIFRKAQIIKTTKDGEAVFEKAPGGHTIIKLMVGGKQKALIMPDEFAKEWVHRDPLIKEQLANFIGWVSGSRILKAMATGLNPEFALTNFPRDIAHVYIVSQEYSNILPAVTYPLQIGRDFLSTAKDAWLRKGAWQDYLDEGGGMTFLTNQGRPFKTANKAIRRVQNVLGYLGESSEIWTRLALRKRALRNGLEPHEATWEARNYLDFSQGGSVAKALDTGWPYFNAGIQGTRGIFRAVADHPIATLWKFANLGALAVGLYLANRSCNKECLDSVSDRDKVNNFIITTPFSIKDKSGNERHFYFKIAKDQGQRVLCTIFENMMARYLGDEVDADQITSAVQDFLPIIPTQQLPPSLDAFMGYTANRDFWTNKDLWKGGKMKPVSEEYTPYTHPALVKAGKAFHLSPERLKYSLSQFFTRGNIYTSLVGGGLNLTMRSMDEADKRKVSAEVIQNLPFVRRVFKLTPPYSEKEMKEQENVKVEENTRRYKQKRELSEMSNTFYRKLYDDKTKDRDLLFKIRGFIKDQPTEDRTRLALWFKNYGRIYDIPERVWWLNLSEMPPEARAYVFWNKWLESDEDDQKEMYQLLKKIPGISSDRFYKRLKILRAKWRKLQ